MAPKKRDYYEVLAVNRHVDQKELKNAYRRLARQHHPDHNATDDDAEERFKELGEAYGILSDVEKRATYDALGHEGFSAAELCDAIQVSKRVAGPDYLRPLVGAGTCFLLYRVLLYILVPIGDVMGGQMIALTVPPLVAAAISSAIAMAIFETRRVGDTGLAWVTGTGRNLMIGIGLGLAAAALAVLPAVAFGLAHFHYSSKADVSVGGALFTPVLLFCGAMGEEIAFRGFALQYLIRGYDRWIPIVGLAILFGLLHAGNPGATVMSTVNTAGFGIVFGAAVLRSQDLWLSAGIHFAWNAALPFLGVGLSGLTIKVTGYELIWNAGEFWSGGHYGPEASGVTAVVIAVLLVAIWKVPVSKGSAYLVSQS